MDTNNWLLLTDYSSKYRISVSTLRRRIKNDQIAYKFINGKYFIRDGAPTDAEEPSLLDMATGPTKPPSPPSTKVAMNAMTQTLPLQVAAEPAPLKSPFSLASPAQAASILPQLSTVAGESESALLSKAKESGKEEPLLETATRLLTELKKAYTSILQEKEEQLIQLKKEVADLKTLVRALEDDNSRMRSHLGIK